MASAIPYATYFALALTAVGVLACSAASGTAQMSAGRLGDVVSATQASSETRAAAPAPDLVTPASALNERRVCIDPGHDSPWNIGASGYTRARTVPLHPADWIPLHEHELTLAVAYRLKALLESEGALVCVTRRPREEGGGLQTEPYDFTGDGRVRTIGQAVEDVPEVIQPRIDWANAFGVEVLLSIHFNGSGDPALRGTEAYYSDIGARQEEGRLLAAGVLEGLLGEMRSAGHAAIDRGVRSDKYQRYAPEDMRRILAHNAATIRANGYEPADCGDCYRLATLGNNPMSLHRGDYLAALVEVEFLSNPDVVEGFLLRPDSLDVIASGLVRGLRAYFAAGSAELSESR